MSTINPGVGSGGGGSATSVSINDGVTTSTKATVIPLTSSNPQAVAIVDTSGNQIASFGGGTQYTEGVTTSPVTGTAALGRISLVPTTLTTNGLYAQQYDAQGNLRTNTSALYFPTSTNNSSTAQLAAAATFTGTIETIQNLQAAQIEVFSDQPFTLTINQYIDAGGTKLSSSDIFTRAAGVPYSENVTLPGNFFNLTLKNTGLATTTTLQIDTTFGIMATGPRTVTSLGNNRTAINEVGGTAVSGSLPVNNQTDFKDDFPGTSLNASNWTVSQAAGTGTSFSVANSQLSFVTGTTANDYIAFTSKQTFTLPFRAEIILNMSQRIANQSFYFEMVNASGTSATALAATGVTTGTTQAAYLFNGAVATTGMVVAQNQGVKNTVDTANTIGSTALNTIFEIDARAQSTDYATRVSEAAGSANITNNGRELSILDPGEQYFLQIRYVCTTAPATTTTVNVFRVLVENTNDTAVEISSGRGQISLQRSLPVLVNSGALASVGVVSSSTMLNTSATGTITTSASAVSSLAANGYGGFYSVTVHGTYAGVSFGISVSDDSAVTFYPTSIYDVTAQQWLPPNASITPGTNASKAYLVPILADTVVVKVLATAYTSGTATINIRQTSAPNVTPSYMGQIQDAAGNARGANVTASNALVVDASATTQPISGTVTANPGALPGTVIAGQKAVTSTVSSLASNALTQGVIIEALSTNTVSVFVGTSSVTATTGIELLPGASTSVAVSNTNLIGVITASGSATVTFIGS